MKAGKPYLASIWVLIGIAVFGIFQLALIYFMLRGAKGNVNSYRAFVGLFIIVLPIVEAFIYWRLRFNIQKKVWARIHVWLLFAAIVLLPILMFVSGLMIALNYPPANRTDLIVLLDKIHDWSFWFLFLIAHIFFIATIVRHFTRKKETKENEAPAGLLDEFVS